VPASRLPSLGHADEHIVAPQSLVVESDADYEYVAKFGGALRAVTHVEINYRLEHTIPLEWWPIKVDSVQNKSNDIEHQYPETLRTLKYSSYHFNNDSFKKLPTSLTALHISNGSGFSPFQDSESDYASLKHLLNLRLLVLPQYWNIYKLHPMPPNLEELTIGHLCYTITIGQLPATLRSLKIRETYSARIEADAYPASLTRLDVGPGCGSALYWQLPETLRELHLSLNGCDGVSLTTFMRSVPDTIEVLVLDDPAPDFIVSRWPRMLRRLDIHLHDYPACPLSFDIVAFPGSFSELNLEVSHTNADWVRVQQSHQVKFQPGEALLQLHFSRQANRDMPIEFSMRRELAYGS
jgi:hypothetical protein